MTPRMTGLAAVALLGLPVVGHTAMFDPKQEDVCDAKSDLMPTLVVLKLLDTEKITDRMIDVTGGPIDAATRARAVSDPNFCSGNHCAEKAEEALLNAANNLTGFLKRALAGKSENFQLTALPTVDSKQSLLHEFAVAGHYQGKCAPVKPAPAVAADKAADSGLEIRSQVADLQFGRSGSTFKGLDPAKLGFDDDRAANTKKYSADIALGYRLHRTHFGQAGQRVDFVPFLEHHQKRTKSEPPPKNPGTNTLSGGIVFDVLTHWGFWQSLQLYPEYTKNRQDKSEVASLNLHYVPQPGIAGMDNPHAVRKLFYVMLEPSLNVAWSDVRERGSNPEFVTANDFVRYGPEVNLRLFGYEGSPLEQLSLSAQYRYFGVSGGPAETLKIANVSLSYSPITAEDSAATVSFTLSWTRGTDLDTLAHVHELVLGVGLKY